MKTINQGVTAKGRYHIVVKDKDGNVKQDVMINNVTTTVYRALMIERAFNETPSADILVDYIAVGTGTNTAAVSDTQLQTEVARKLRLSLGNASNIGTVSTTFSSGDIPSTPTTITEVGLFCNGTTTPNSGTLVSRANISIEVASTDSLFLDYQFTLSDA